MVDFIDRLSCAVDSACMEFINAGVTVKKGLLIVGEGTSRAMYEVYSLQGFEKWSKAAIANMRAIELIPYCKGIFSSCIKTIEAQKDLIYATLVFESTADFIKVTKTVDDATGEESTSYSVRLPRLPAKDRDGYIVKDEYDNIVETDKIDWVKLFYGIGNPFETLYFLQKYKVVSFPLVSRVSTQVGAMKIFTLSGEAWTFGDIPVLNCLVNKPKDFFVCIASGYSAYKCLRNRDFWAPANLIKLTGSIGKIVLITSADYMLQKKYLVALAVIDVVTQNASLIGLLIKRREEREMRFNDPTRC